MAPALAVTSPTQSTSNQPQFRILMVIPTLGERLDTIGRTLASIRDQAHVAVDIVIVSKFKTAGLVAVADQYKAEITVHPGNISAAINAGFAHANASHRYVNWIGDDDFLRPDALRVASALLEENPAAVVAYGSCDYVTRGGTLLFKRKPPHNAPTLLLLVPGLIKQESCLFRLSAVNQVLGVDEKLKYTMDLDLLLKLRRVGSFIESNKSLAAFCWHPGSLTVANRRASLTEAQDVQASHVRGIAKILQPFWRYPIRYLILIMSWKINRELTQTTTPASPD